MHNNFHLKYPLDCQSFLTYVLDMVESELPFDPESETQKVVQNLANKGRILSTEQVQSTINGLAAQATVTKFIGTVAENLLSKNPLPPSLDAT
jgi:hypothetical protein